MISPISGITSYRVQSVYGNPSSMKPVSSVREDTQANKALLTVKKEQESEDAKKSKEMDSRVEEDFKSYAPTTSVAVGGAADIVKQISKMSQDQAENTLYAKEEEMHTSGNLSINKSPFENELLKMGSAQSVRDMVSESKQEEDNDLQKQQGSNIPGKEALAIAS